MSVGRCHLVSGMQLRNVFFPTRSVQLWPERTILKIWWHLCEYTSTSTSSHGPHVLRAWRNEGKSPEDILPLGEVINIIYDSMKEHGLRVEDNTRVRALVCLIDQMKVLLEDRKEEVGDKHRKH